MDWAAKQPHLYWRRVPLKRGMGWQGHINPLGLAGLRHPFGQPPTGSPLGLPYTQYTVVEIYRSYSLQVGG